MLNRITVIVSSMLIFAVMNNAHSNPFANTHSISCDFLPGINAQWKEDKVIQEKSRFGGPITFHSLNFDQGTAVMKGNTSSVNVRLFSTDKGMTFLEWLDGDTMVVTTVYAYAAVKNPPRLSAVHSRHKFLFAPLVAQYYGSCQLL